VLGVDVAGAPRIAVREGLEHVTLGIALHAGPRYAARLLPVSSLPCPEMKRIARPGFARPRTSPIARAYSTVMRRYSASLMAADVILTQ
jgi:hypothetical protein